MKKIPYGRQSITTDDIEAVVEVLRSDFLTQGPKISEFEIAFANYIGAKYAVAVSNGTAALHLSALSLNVNPGDKVITTPITFVATANCVKYCGGDTVFADIDSTSYLLDINKVMSLLDSHPKGTFKGIIPVDFSGRAVNLEKYRDIADEYGCWIIEDACHAPGGCFFDKYNSLQKCGNGNFADLAVFSFHPVKHIACGEGGIITTNSEDLYGRLINLRTHGIQQDYSKRIYDDSLWYYEMQSLGYNYRLTDIQAALGISQLKRANDGLRKRIEIAQRYFNAFCSKEYILNQSGIVEGHAYHLYIIEVENRRELHKYLREHNIFSQIHYLPCHLMPYYRQFGWKEGDLPVAENYYKNCLSLPIFPTLTIQEQEFVIQKIFDFFN